MKNYCYLDIPQHEDISDLIYNYLINNYDISKFQFWTDIDVMALCKDVSELTQALDRLNLTIATASIIRTIGTCPIHVDYGKPPHIVSRPRVLWPIKNCNGSSTNFFHIERQWLQERQLPNGVPYYHIEHNDPLIQIDSFELKQPAVINPNVAHNVVCNNAFKEHRISLTIETNEQLYYLLDRPLERKSI